MNAGSQPAEWRAPARVPAGRARRGTWRGNLFIATMLVPVATVAVLAAARVAARHADAVRLAWHGLLQPDVTNRQGKAAAPGPVRSATLADAGDGRRLERMSRYAALFDAPPPLDPLAAEYDQALHAIERDRAAAYAGAETSSRRSAAPTQAGLDAHPANGGATTTEPPARASSSPGPARVAALPAPEARVSQGRQRQPGDADAPTAAAWARQGRLGEAEASYRALLAGNPRDVDALMGLAGVLAREGRDDEAHALLATADGLAGGRRTRLARAGVLREEAQGSVDPATRTALYRQALALNPADPWVRLDLARALAAQGRAEEARAAMSGMTGAGAGADDLKAAAIFAGETGAPETASALIERLPYSARTADMRALQSDAEMQRDIAAASALPTPEARRRLLALAAAPDADGSRGVAVARALARLGDAAGAREALLAAQASTPGAPVAARLRYAAAYLDIGDVASARRLFGGIDGDGDLALDQRPAYAQLGAALALRSAGDPDRASGRMVAGQAVPLDDGTDAPARRADLGTASWAGDRGRAQSLAAEGARSGSPQAGAAEPRAAASDGSLAAPTIQAGYRYRRVLDTTASTLAPPQASSEEAASDAMQAGTDIGTASSTGQVGISGQAALGVRSRWGDAGLDRLTEVTAPLEAEYVPGGHGQLKLAVVPTSLVAGRIGGDAADARRFGSAALTSGSAVAGRSSHAVGVGLDVGYVVGNLNADVGATPLGFAIQHAVGGLSYAPVLADGVRLRATVERRAVTDSVLSYAGARDPRSGATWGGVVRTRGRANVEFDVWRGRAYIGAGGGVVTGVGTPSNGEMEAAAGFSVPVYATDSRLLSVGVDLAYSGYARNLRYFTLGQGGYFSPQRYVAALLPVRYMERVTADLSYAIGAALGVQNYHENASPYYPADAALQARLVSAGGGLPRAYAARSRTGLAGNGNASVDYRALPNLHLGARISAQHSGDFTEASGVAYARYSFGAGAP